MLENVAFFQQKGKKSPGYEHCKWGEGRTCFVSQLFCLWDLPIFRFINHKLQKFRNLAKCCGNVLGKFRDNPICTKWKLNFAQIRTEFREQNWMERRHFGKYRVYLTTEVFLSGNSAKRCSISNWNFQKVEAEGLVEFELPRKNDRLLHSTSLSSTKILQLALSFR